MDYVDRHSRYHYAMVEAAKARADALRGESLDRLRDGSGARALQSLRAARRFASSLARHARLREGAVRVPGPATQA